MSIIDSIEIAYRRDFSLLCNARGLDVAVEVGTDCGFFAADFMSRWNGRKLYCVDPYQPYDEMNRPRAADRMMAVLGLQPYYGRVRFIECEERT